jgi:hypothetical protein
MAEVKCAGSDDCSIGDHLNPSNTLKPVFHWAEFWQRGAEFFFVFKNAVLGRVYTMTQRQIYRSAVICIRSAKRGGP